MKVAEWKMPERMQLVSIWAVWAFLALGLIGWAMMVVVNAVGIKDAPTWVQAVGSVIGIGIAIAVPAWQKSVAAAVASEAEFRSRKTSYHAFWVLVDECKAVMEELNKFLWYHAPMPARGTFARRQIVGKLRAYSHEMSQVPVEAFGFDVVPAVLRLKSEATFLQCVADEIEGGFDLGAIRIDIFTRSQKLGEIDKEISDLIDWLDDLHGKS